jgi:hypothetical protein
MPESRRQGRFTTKRTLSVETASACQHDATEIDLAHLVAKAFASENPQAFTVASQDTAASGPSSAAAEVSVAPAEQEGGPDAWSVEHDGEQSTNRRV